MVFQLEDGKELASADVVSASARRQRLAVLLRGEEPTLVLSEAGARMRSWPLHAVKLTADQPGGNITVEAGGETMTWSCTDDNLRKELCRAATTALAEGGKTLGEARLGDAALTALLEDAAPDDADAELWVRKLADRLARLDALNVGGMLAAATEGGGAKLSSRLEAGVAAGAALSARLARYEAVSRAAPATHARSGAARADDNARALLNELDEIYTWLDSPALQDIDSLAQVSLATAEGRARAVAACDAVRNALRAEKQQPAARKRLAAVRDRLRKLHRAKDQLSGALARQLNNLLIHACNEAAAGSGTSAVRRHAELLPHAPHTRWLKEHDYKAYSALLKVYVTAWSRVLEREIRAACDAAKVALATAPPEKADELLDQVLTLVENLCNAEQDFCTQFFHLDVDTKSENSDGERSEKSDGGERDGKKATAETKKLMTELFPTLDTELVQLLNVISNHDTYGAMRALACVGRRVLGAADPPGGGGGGGGGGAGGGGGGGEWARAALAGAAVAAKRAADRIVADRIAALPDAVKQASRKAKCGVLPFVAEFEELARHCEDIFRRNARRADVERWYVSLAGALLHAVLHADHPRTPKAIVHMENYHRLHGVLSSLRVPALEPTRRECKQRYQDSLRAYVTQYFGRPLEKLTLFFEGVAEAVAGGVKEDEVCYRAAFSKHELRRLLAMYPAHEVRKSLSRLYRSVEKQLCAQSGLLQVVWRAMQEEFLAQHLALQARITACYPGSGLSMPLSTQDILDAFSDIAREH